MKYKWKLRITFSLIGLVILSCGIALAVYFNSEDWKNRANPAAVSSHPATDNEILETLATHLEEWTKNWKSGNIAALTGPMVFFSETVYPAEDMPDQVIPISDEDFQKELSEKFGDLLEDTLETETGVFISEYSTKEKGENNSTNHAFCITVTDGIPTIEAVVLTN